MTRILIWATTFGADLWSYARHLDGRDDVELVVRMSDPALFARQPVARLFPFRAQLVRARRTHDYLGVWGFRPDLTVVDNWIPRRPPSDRALMLWHGFGWGAGTNAEGFATLHREIARNWGDARVPNANFRWQCFGPTDHDYRTRQSGLAADNCRILGAASHDDLIEPLDRTLVQSDYPFDVVGRKTVLIAPTWAYGEVFAHWGEELDVFRKLIAHIEGQGANVLLRLHDSFRFSEDHRAKLAAVAAEHDNVLLKYKDHAPDNFIDLQVADVLITNFSSIANLYYATRRPSIHIHPAKDADSELVWRTRKHGKLVEHRGTIRELWKMPPEENGGLLAHSLDELFEQVEQSLSDPACCEGRANEFLARHMLPADGRNCERIDETVAELVG